MKNFLRSLRFLKSKRDRIDFDRVRFDCADYQFIKQLCIENDSINPGCILHPHWLEANDRDIEVIRKDNRLRSLNWLESGYPKKTKSRSQYEDSKGMASKFVNHETLDIQSGLHQFYSIAQKFQSQGMEFFNLERINVLEVGGGYGRLALFFFAYFGRKCHYVNIDYVPISLTFCPQVIRFIFPELSVMDVLSIEHDSELLNYNFISLPAWEVRKLQPIYNFGINIHSFQEMHKDTFDFYIQLFFKKLRNNGLLYTVNNPPCQGLYPRKDHSWYGYEKYFREISRSVYPFGTDPQKLGGIPCLERVFVKKQNIGSTRNLGSILDQE